jgi:peptide/nickel transport system substrate-binding protein
MPAPPGRPRANNKVARGEGARVPKLITRRDFALGMGAFVAASGMAAPAPAADKQTLRFILKSDLRVLDPIWTTTYATRNHGYMIFDTLFALDAQLQPHPQMVGDYSVSADGLTYRFALRDGLGFHDGQPVRGADCVASLRRWMARDTLGQILAKSIDEMSGADDVNFTIRLKEPFPLLLHGLAKVSSLTPFVMPERVAKTDPFKQITETVGSGPFKFVKEEFQPGYKAVYVKNADYVPRKEPPSWASGGKVVKVDRVEWANVPEHSTAAAALADGEFDWWEEVPPDLVAALVGNPDLTVARNDPIGSMAMLRFNQLQPPFDKMKMRQAVMAVVDQSEFMGAIAGDRKNWSECASFFACGTPMANDAGSETLTGKRDVNKAKQLISEAGYKGEKIVVLDGVDQANFHVIALVAADLMKKLGLNVELVSTDWSTLVARRASKKPVDQGGWSVVPTSFAGIETIDPSANLPLAANGEAAWFGWPSDSKLETLRAKWMTTADQAQRKALAAQIQQRAFEVVPYVPLGQWWPMTAYRKTLKGVSIAPVEFMWNIEKA